MDKNEWPEEMNVAKTQLMVLTRKGKYHMAEDVEVKIGNTCLEKQNWE